MNASRVQILRQRLSALSEDLTRLETKRDGIIDKRCATTWPEERVRYSGQAGSVYAAISDVERRIRHARRLLAHHQGDEYQV